MQEGKGFVNPWPRIKICGITREEDARIAVRLGVDALGFVMAESPRKIAPEAARQICRSLPPFVDTVGVFVDMDEQTVAQIAAFCPLDWVQLHGGESPSYCEAFYPRVLKALRVKDRQSLAAVSPYLGRVAGFVLDAYVEGQLGGTGKSFDWSLAQEAKQYGPVILAGGLNPDNVRVAVEQVRPYGVDVSSGVETAPGVKDHEKMRRFVEQVRLAGKQP